MVLNFSIQNPDGTYKQIGGYRYVSSAQINANYDCYTNAGYSMTNTTKNPDPIGGNRTKAELTISDDDKVTDNGHKCVLKYGD